MDVKFCLFVALFIAVDGAVFQMKMEKGESKSLRLLKEGGPQQFREFRTSFRKNRQSLYNRANSHHKSRLSASQPIYDFYDEVYTVIATVGSPPQLFSLYVDTVFGITWVPDSTCDNDHCGCRNDDGPLCVPKHKFYSNKSSTYKKAGHYFMDSSGEGFWGIDTVGLSSGLRIPNVTFGQMIKPFYFVDGLAFDGFLNLAYKTENGEKSVIQTAYDQQLLDKPIYTIFLGVDGNDARNKTGGLITYGDVDKVNCESPFIVVPVRSDQFWEFSIDSTEINGQTKSSANWIAVADTGPSTIEMPAEPLGDLIKETNAKFATDFGLYEVGDCNLKFNWSIVLESQKLTLDETALLWKYEDRCFLLVEQVDDNADFNFLLGLPFVHSHCQYYDITGRIGFSKAKH